MVELVDLHYQSRGVGPISVSLQSGQLIWLCGPSGSGKSTLCQLLLGDLDPSQGAVRWEEGVTCGFLASDVESQLLGSSVAQELEFSARLVKAVASPGWLRLQDELRARFEGRLEVDPHDLSRGEQQILLLSSLVLGPFSCLVLDEGLSGLDQSAFLAFVELLRQVADAGALVVVVSHEARLLGWADRVLGLAEGKVWLDASPAQLSWADFERLQLWSGARLPGPADQLVMEGPWGLAPVGSQCLGQSIDAGFVSDALAQADAMPRPDILPQGCAVMLAGASGSGRSRVLHDMRFSSVPSDLYRVLLTDNPVAMLGSGSVRTELAQSAQMGLRRGSAPRDWEIPLNWLERLPRALSTGQRKLLACRCLLLQSPDVLLLEDPFSGLDGQLRRTLEKWLRCYLDEGGRLVFSSHSPDEILLYPNLTVLLDHGSAVWCGTPALEMLELPACRRLGAPGFLPTQFT